MLSAQYPANEWLRAAQGWGALERGHAGSARGHFEQALALDPTSRWTQDGLIESMKAEHPIYRQLLRLFLWLERLPPRTKWVIILGGLFTYRALRRTAESNPALAPALYPLMAIWVAFVLLSWTADSLSDFVLSRTERARSMVTGARLRAANLIVGLISLALLLAVGAVVTGVEQFSAGALCAGLLVIPTAAVFRSPAGWPRTTMRVYTLIAACAGLGALLLPVPSNRLAAALCLLMSVLGSWFGVFLSSRRPARQ